MVTQDELNPIKTATIQSSNNASKCVKTYQVGNHTVELIEPVTPKNKPYNEMYLSNAMDRLGCALDYAVNALGVDGQEFLTAFAKSTVGKEMGRGSPYYVAGRSGIDVCLDVLNQECDPNDDNLFIIDYSPEYWVGYILAYYQWNSNLTYEELIDDTTFKTIYSLYFPLHEADITKTKDVLDDIQEKKVNGHTKNEIEI